MTQTHSKKFHCTYLLHYYPFDTQVSIIICRLDSAPSISMFQICRVDLQVEEFDKRSVELLPDKMDLMTDTELTQYFMKTWILDFNDPGKYVITPCMARPRPQ